MKKLQLLTTVAVAALAVAVLVGAGTASAATVLCQSAESLCSEANTLPAGTNFGGYAETETGGSFTLKTSLAIYKCGVALFGGKTTAQSGNPLPATGEVLIDKCTGAGDTCTTAGMTTPPVSLTATTGGNGTMTFGSSASHVSFTMNCGAPFNCVYGTSSLPLTYDSSVEGTISAKEVTLTKESGSFCGSTGTLSLNLNRTVSVLFSQVHGTVQCQSGTEVPCSNANTLPAGTIFGGYAEETGGSFTLKAPPTVFSCRVALFAGKTTAQYGNPLPATGEVLTEKCSGFAGTDNCTTAGTTTPPVSLTATTGGNGTVTYGSSASHMSFTFNCGISPCVYGTSSLPLTYNSSEQTISAKEVPLGLESGLTSICPKTGNLSLNLNRSVSYPLSKN